MAGFALFGGHVTDVCCLASAPLLMAIFLFWITVFHFFLGKPISLLPFLLYIESYIFFVLYF
jgi:hypothetical protein